MTFLALGAAAAAMLAVTLTPVSAQLAGGGNAKAEAPAAKGGKGGKGGKGKAKNAGPTERIGTVAINQPDFGGPGIWGVPYITNMSNSITDGGLATCEQFPNGTGGGSTPSCAPFTALGKEVFAGRRKTDSATDPEGYCLPPGVPRMMYTPYPMKIIQEPDFVTFIFEGGAHVWRQIPIGPRGFLRHEADPNPTYLGDAIGWWEGDTLVVDTIGFNERTWLDFAGHPHGEKLHVIERFTRLDTMTLQHAATIEDPDYYTQPWTVTITTSYRPVEKLFEYICQENERDSAHNEEHLRKLGIDPDKIR
jgi:hypothetical protein